MTTRPLLETHRLELGQCSLYEPADKTPPVAGAILGLTATSMEYGCTVSIRQDGHPLIYRASQGYGDIGVIDPNLRLYCGYVPYRVWCWVIPY